MKNIVIFSNHLLAHSQTFIRAQGEALTSYNAHYFGSDRVVTGLSLPESRTHIVKSGFLGNFTDKLLKLGIVLPNLLRRFKLLEPELIHAHFGPNGLTALPLAEKLKSPLLVTFHGFDVIDRPNLENHGRLHLRYMEKRSVLADRATHLIAVSESIKERLIRLGFPESKIIRHYIGVDVELFAPSPEVIREKIILCVGRMIPIKGHEFLIEAMGKIQKLAPDYKLVLIGDGDEQSRLQTLAKSKKINVEFTGRQTQKQVKHWMQKATVYVQPSVKMANGQEEALALTIVEAQALGTPAVVFNSGGMPEAIIDGETGTVVSEKNVDGLADAILNLSYDHDLWERYSRNAIEFVHEKHNLKKQCLELENIYQAVLQSK